MHVHWILLIKVWLSAPPRPLVPVITNNRHSTAIYIYPIYGNITRILIKTLPPVGALKNTPISWYILRFKEAFDSVDHPILIGKLEYCSSIRWKALGLIVLYLSDRTQVVKINNIFSR